MFYAAVDVFRKEYVQLYTAKNAPVTTSLLKSCNNLFQQADIRMRSHGLRHLADDKSVASCQQACCKLILKTSHPQACCKLFQHVATSHQMTSCNKPDFNKCCDLVKLTSLLQLVSKLPQASKIDKLQQACGVFGCVVLFIASRNNKITSQN